MNWKIFSFLLIAVISLSACKKEDIPNGERGAVIEQKLITSLTKDEIISSIDEFDGTTYVKYDVDIYQVTYQSNFNNKAIKTRGLLLVPKTTDSTFMLLYCHGTHIPSKLLGANKMTPSLYTGAKTNFEEVRNIGLALSTQGYSVFMPDYIGYALTADKEHPYVLFDEQYKQNIDGMIATKKILHQLGYQFDNRLFISGWSQGAGCAISAHKYTQEQYASTFDVVASSGYAGPYDFERFAEELLKNPNQEVDVIQLFCWYTYVVNRYKGMNRPTDQIFTYPVYDQFSAILAPTKVPAKNFQNYFLDGVAQKTDTEVINNLRANSFHKDWTPQGKIFLHHGKKDAMIPYATSEAAYIGLTAAGGDITLYTYEDGTHFNVLKDYIQRTIIDFNALK